MKVFYRFNFAEDLLKPDESEIQASVLAPESDVVSMKEQQPSSKSLESSEHQLPKLDHPQSHN